MATKFKITIRRIQAEDYEMELESETIVTALDEIRRIIKARNKSNINGTFHLYKIETEK